MRVLNRMIPPAVAIGIALLPCIADAQSAPVTVLPMPGTPMPRNMKMTRAYTIQRGMPYSGVRVVRHVDIFPNGYRQEDGSSTKEWRDSEGRTRKDVTWTTRTGQVVTVCTIDDPVELVRYIWKLRTGQKTVVTETHYKMEGTVTEVWPGPPGHDIQPIPGATVIILRPQHALNANLNDETLGPEYINGLYATGTRSVEVFLPGQGGNHTDHPIKRIDEIWSAPDLNTVVKMYFDTGRGFTESSELKDIDRSEPDPSVFLPPANLPRRQAPESDPVWKEPIGG